MSNQWLSIGINSREELSQAIDIALKSPSDRFENHETGRTNLLTDGFLELWVHIDAKCPVSSFGSSTIVKAKAIKWIEHENGCPYCAMLSIEVLSDEELVLYPLAVTFDNVAFARESIEIGKPINLAVSSFVINYQHWDSVESYKHKYPDRKVGPGWFIPLGPFSALERLRNNNPGAAFYGVVKRIQKKQNPWTHNNYQHLSLECSGKIYEVVVSDDKTEELSIGNLVYVECWLCASTVS